jgi:hypothetical protein
MNRRIFTKLLTSAIMADVVTERTALPAHVRLYGPAPLMEKIDQSKPGDAYAHRDGMIWTLGTSKSERKVALRDGRFVLTSFKNKLTGREYRDIGPDPEEIRFSVDETDVSSPISKWEFVSDHTQQLGQGELQLDIKLKARSIEVTKHWVVYPHTAIVREWLTIENASGNDVRIHDLFFLNSRLLGGEPERLELSYISGGGNFNGSQLLKTERVSYTYKRMFDSDAGVQRGNYSAYLPLVLLRDPTSGDNLAIGWDYMGHWSLQVGDERDRQMGIVLKVAGYDGLLRAGTRLETPKAFLAALSGSLDDIGNQILDWQYQYLWELTNPDYFGKTRWAVDWPAPWVGDGGTPSADNWGRRLALDLRYTDLLRECGGDILWDDAGWYDSWGSWNGPDWRLTTNFVQKHGIGWVLWYPTFLATPQSAIGQKHPDWLIPRTLSLEQSIPGTETWQKHLLDESVARWQDFQYRYDIAPAAAGDDTKLLAADQNFRKLLEEFKTSHPKSGVDACDGGGRWISYDLARLAESGEYTDGGVGPYSGYYTSLIIPPDKVHNVSDFDHTYYNPSSDRVHLALDPTWYRDPGDGADLEFIRKDWEIYHYLIAKGVAGRGSHVFRPRVANDDAIWYFQRMDAEGKSGIIITKHAKRGPAYFLVSKPLSNASGDHYEGGTWQMTRVMTTNAAVADTGIYADPIDNDYRYYGVPGEMYGPLNFRYRSASGDAVYVTQITRQGALKEVNTGFFGMAFQMGDEPITISELGQYDPRGREGSSGGNQGVYSLMLIRASDKTVLGSVTLDMGRAQVDALGFKYAKLETPIRLDPGPDKPVVVFPGGLQPDTNYEVQTCHAAIHLRASGKQLMADGISLPEIKPGELIFLNLPNYPGSGTDKVAPEPPSKVTKRKATNLGTMGVEVAWSPGRDNNWISYYEILRNGTVLGKAAIGNFYFDHSERGCNVAAEYAVRTVDGDGNRSSPVTAQAVTGEPEVHQALGEFGPTQSGHGWGYEQTVDARNYEELRWDNGGYEGFWAGSGMGRIGRIWCQPSAAAEISRTFRVAANGSVSLTGQIQKDPSARSEYPVRVRIEHEEKQIWPASGWAEIPAFGAPLTYQVRELAVRKGDVIRFVVQRSGQDQPQPIIWNPSIEVHDLAG